MIRFGMCGCGGFIEKAVLPMMLRAGNARPVAAFDMNAATLDRVCGSFGIGQKCAGFDELINLKDVDAVYIASPNVFHRDQAIRAAKAGKHVFCQKPMGMNAEDCRQMLEACEQNGVKMGLGFCYRFQGAQETVKRMIDDNAVGKVSYIYFSFNLGGYNPETAGWRCDARMSGGGPLMDLAPHVIDLISFLTGDRVRSVMSYVKPDRTPEQIELDADVIMELSGGARASMNVSFVRGNMHNYTVVGTGGQMRAVGTMCWNNRIPGIEKGKLYLEKGMESIEVPFETEEQLEKEMRLFCEALESGNEPPVPGEYGWYVQKVVDAIYESGMKGIRVSTGENITSHISF